MFTEYTYIRSGMSHLAVLSLWCVTGPVWWTSVWSLKRCSVL